MTAAETYSASNVSDDAYKKNENVKDKDDSSVSSFYDEEDYVSNILPTPPVQLLQKHPKQSNPILKKASTPHHCPIKLLKKNLCRPMFQQINKCVPMLQ